MWICPKCETRNDTDRCVICGEVRPKHTYTQQRQKQQTTTTSIVVPPYKPYDETATESKQNRTVLLVLTCVLATLILSVAICILAVVMSNENEKETSGLHPEVISNIVDPVEKGILPDDAEYTEETEIEEPEEFVKPTATASSKPTVTPKPTQKPMAKPALSAGEVKDKLRQFAEYGFTDVRMQLDAFTPIFDCHSFARQTQKVLKYDLMDLNGDGKDEVVISSEITGGESEESVGYSCFSVWTVDKTGDIKCVMAKAGWPSRFAYSYSVVRYNGAYMLLESGAGGNSTGQTMYRNLYQFVGETIIEKNVYTYQVYDGISECTIDRKAADSTAVWNKIADVDNHAEVIIRQVFPNI